MRTAKLVQDLNQRGIFLSVENGKLKTRSEAVAIDAQTAQKIRDHRDELIRFLDEGNLRSVPVGRIPRLEDRDAAVPASFAQQGLWFIDQLEGGSAQYHVLVTLKLSGRLDLAALQHTLDVVVARHEVLRTRFAREHGEVLQWVCPAQPVPIAHVALGALGGSEQSAALEQLANQEARKPFDLSAALLLRATIACLSAQEHVALFCIHHIASDGWSKDILLREFCSLYSAHRRGVADPLPPLPIQYRDFAVWQRNRLQAQGLQAQIDWWAAQLRGAPPVHGLPLRGARPAQQQFSGGMYKVQIPADITRRLHTMCVARGMTPFVLLHAVFALLIARYSNERDIVVGTPVSGRVHTDIEPLVGFFVNTLVLRSRIEPHLTFDEWLQRNRQSVLDAFGHQDVPFEMLVDALKPERSLSYSPLFQILFSFHHGGATREVRLPDLAVETLQLAEHINQFDMVFNISGHGDELLAACSYNRTLFEAGAIARLLDSFRVLLDAALDRPDRAIGSLPLLDTAEHRRLLEDCHPAARAYAEQSLVHELFEAQVDKTPRAPSLICGEEQLDYRTLNERANRLAHYLVERGVSPGTRVGLCVRRSAEMMIALLGTLKAGGTYVPLDPQAPAERQRFVVKDAGLSLILTHLDLCSEMPFADCEVLPLDFAEELLRSYPVHNPRYSSDVLRSDCAAYVIYTSGSTGHPKGVVVPHRGIVNYLEHAGTHYLREDICGSLVATPFTFDATVTTLMVPWLAGKPVVMLADESNECLMQVLDYCRRPAPWLFKLTPAHLDALTNLMDTEPCVTRHLFVVGGEQLMRRSLQRFRMRVCPGASVINEYGPTETVVGCTTFVVEAHEDAPCDAAVPIGRSIQNTQIYLLDECREPVPVGVAGELHIGGAGVTHGYLNRPELTAERFIVSPFNASTQLYRTGDLARWLANGDLQFIGRVDDQVKVKGFRIELGEIEAALSAHAGVAGCCVVASEDASGTKHLVAYVVPVESAPAAQQDESEAHRHKLLRLTALQDFLRKRLPEYMLPAALVLLASLPLTANHKIDKAALPAPDDQDFAKEIYVAPGNALEQALVAIWREVLGLEAIGIDDHFFRLGGHSLLATQVVSEIAERLQRRVAVRVIFEHPTIRSLAAHLAQQQTAQHLPLPVVSRAAQLPLSFAQQRLWFIDQLEGGSWQYHIAAALRLQGRLNRTAMQQAMDAILARHEVLRTRYVTVDGEAVQRIDPAAALHIDELDLSAAADSEHELSRFISATVGQPFDLSADALLRCALVRLGEDSHVAILTTHHIASDGWSTTVLIEEFAALYAAFRKGAANPLSPLDIQYADYAHWQRNTLQGATLERELAYWRQQLAGIPAVHGLPLDKPRPASQDFKGGRVAGSLDAALLARLQTLARDRDASLFMVLQSAFAVLLGRWSHETDIVVGTPVAGRTRKEIEPLIGCFINSLVLRTDLSGDPSFVELLAQVKQTALSAYEHQSVPFEMLVEELKPERSLNHAPIFQVSFSFHNLEQVELRLPELEVSEMSCGRDVVRFDLELHIAAIPSGLQIRWLYAQSLFEASTIERLAQSFMQLLEAIASDATQPVQCLPLLPVQDQERLTQWSALQVQPLASMCVQQLFEAQVERAPQALAAVFEAQSLSYGELNERANRVARYLLAQGVRPDTVVGLCVERSLEMVIGLLGILKSGAAYLPLDPLYPPERLAQMLADACVEQVLSQRAVLESVPLLSERSVLALDDSLSEAVLLQYAAENVAPTELGLTASHLAYVIYTSGSSGQPKGSMLTHRGLVNLAHNQQELFELGASSRVLAFASMSFDGAVFEWLMALASGASLHICAEAQRQSATSVSQFLRAHRITHAAIPPALLSQVPLSGDYALRVLILGGEACEEQLAWRWAQHCRVCNSYGPSEATVAATHAEIEPGRPITLGRALRNVELKVLNERCQPQPIGVVGELFIGGAGLARGYLQRAELTAQRFIEHPWQAGERLHRTGDLVRWLPSGELQFVGRADEQVKIRGFRIELGEICTQLLSHEAVSEAVVSVRHESVGARLVAYVVCRDSTGVDDSPGVDGSTGVDDSTGGEINEVLLAKAWRTHLRQRLPEYMIPAAFVVMQTLPLNRNGKVDRSRLPAPDYQSQQPHVAPEGEIEQRLAQIWQQVLRVEQVGAHDNFFEIGGDSILAIQVVARANQAQLAITTKQLFESQTIAELSRRVSEQAPVQTPQQAVSGPLVLLPIHHRFLGADSGDQHHYNQAVMLQPPVGFDPGALGVLIDALYRRHDALRLRFEQRAQGWHAEHVPLDEAMVQGSCVSEELPSSAEARRVFLSERCTHWQERFDLQRGPLLRAVYFAAPEHQDSRLLLVVHHIVVDGVSWRVLLTDLERAYRQYQRGERIELGVKSSSYQQWGEALEVYARSEALKAQKAYWLEQSAPSVPLPVDKCTVGWGTIGTTRTVVVSLSVQETRALQQQCSKAYRTQINELLLAGVYLGMRQWTGEAGLRLRLEGHGREELFDPLDLTQTLGWFTSIYPLRLQSARAEVDAVIKAVKEQYRSIPQHGIGYGVLRYLSGDAELIAAAANNEPQLEFNYLGQFDQVLNEDTVFKAALEDVGQKIGPQRARMHQLGLSGKVFGGQLHFVLGYSSTQYEDATIQRLAGYLGEGLRRVIEHCRHRELLSYTPSDFPLARVDQQQLEDWHARYPNLLRLYPATPMQAGLVFESLLEASTYVVQTSLRLQGALDVAAFQRAWQQVIERHDIFRTAFVGAGEQLHQLVCAQALLPWQQQDWRGLSEAEQAQRFEQYRLQDRQAGFDFAQPPLLRLAVFRLGETRYQLLWTLHHILLDGWCLPLVYRDVIALYQVQVGERLAVLGAAPAYEQYIGWLQRQDRSAARAHWRELLGDMQAPTPLIVDRLPAQGSGHREQHLELSVQQTEALRSLAQTHHITVNTLVQWAWGYLLHRYSGEAQVVFGATVSGRAAEVAGIEEMLGLFINTLPVLMSFAGPLQVARSLRVLHESFQKSTEHGYLSLSEIQRESRVPAGTALFDSLLVFENLPVDSRLDAAAMLSGLEIEHAQSQQSTHYKLTLIGNLGARLQIKLSYRAEHFAEATIARLVQHLTRILVQLPQVVASNQAVALLPPDESCQLDSWSLTRRSYARDLCIHEWFEAHADRAPQQIALVMDDQQLTYRELNERANRVAHYLIEQGAQPGGCVGLCVERSFEMIVGILGILKTGAAYVPLDPRYPKSRLAYLLEDSRIDWVLTQSQLERQVSLERVRTFVLDDLAALRAYPTANLAHGVPLVGDQLAVILYTSGSTGRPKGVQLPHRTIVNLIGSLMARYEAMAAAVPTLQFASMSFDWSLAEIGSAFFTGGSLVLISEEDRLDLGALAGVMQRHHVGRTFLTTAMVSQFAQTVVERQIELPALKMLQAGGEQLAITPAIRQWAARSGCMLLNVYGPTESGVVVSVHGLSGDSATWPALPPIGRPVDNVQLQILDASLQRVPIGVSGELCVAGDGLARGYLNRPELNASKFIEAAIDGAEPQRWYRTGDLARWLPDGTIEYVSRVDTQIKLRGFRVEPGEIETLLVEHQQVCEAVVVALGEGSDKQLVAYIVSRDVSDATALHAELQRKLAAELPSYMVPTLFVSLEQLPLSPNRKVDRQALPLPDLRPQVEVAPSTETEARLAAIWRRILKLERVSVQSRFFELGGHSLLATQMVSAVLVEFGCVLKIKDLFTHQTITALAALIDVLSAPSITSDAPALADDGTALEEMEW